MSTLFIIKIVTTQTARNNKTYAKAGAIVSTSVSSIRTILSLNAVQKMIDLYAAATEEACTTAIGHAWVAGLANGFQFVAMILAYILVTLFGSWLLYDNVRRTGCDPSATVDGNTPCDPSGMDVFGALFGVSFAAAILPQVSIALESFAGKVQNAILLVAGVVDSLSFLFNLRCTLRLLPRSRGDGAESRGDPG